MSDESLIAKSSTLRGSAFLDAEKNNDQHIVDMLIEERCPKLRGSWSWPLVRPVLYKTLGYRR
ncbi:MAG TPA: acyltransferase, partial [Hyphomonas sp.]|nr:acyltransferase [Hyphomonas sp.]